MSMRKIAGVAIVAFSLTVGFRYLLRALEGSDAKGAVELSRPGSRSVEPVRAANLTVLDGGGLSSSDQIRGVEWRRKERDADEWQGMRMDVTSSPPCSRSAHCGGAKACIDGRCQACELDEHCSSGELCVLDHCLPESNVNCRVRADCGDEFCVLYRQARVASEMPTQLPGPGYTRSASLKALCESELQAEFRHATDMAREASKSYRPSGVPDGGVKGKTFLTPQDLQHSFDE